MKPKAYFTPQRMTRIALLAAISSILFYWPEIPIIGFYKLDFSNLPVLLGAFSMGPLAGVIILAIKSISGLLHSSSQFVGELADFLFGLALMYPTVLIYQRKKSRKTALIGMITGTVCMIISGVLINAYLLIPVYLGGGLTIEQILGMFSAFPFIDSLEKLLFFATAPFNLIKGGVLSAMTFVLYKHLSPLLHGRGVRS